MENKQFNMNEWINTHLDTFEIIEMCYEYNNYDIGAYPLFDIDDVINIKGAYDLIQTLGNYIDLSTYDYWMWDSKGNILFLSRCDFDIEIRKHHDLKYYFDIDTDMFFDILEKVTCITKKEVILDVIKYYRK